MAIRSSKYLNVPLEALDIVKSVLKNDTEISDLIRLRVVLGESQAKETICLAAVFDIAPEESIEDKVHIQLDYGFAVLIQRLFPSHELIQLFEDTCKSGFGLEDYEEPLGGIPVRAEVEFHPTDFARRRVPYLEIRLQENGSNRHSHESRPLVDPELPYFSDLAHAIRTWCHFSNFESMSDHRIGQVVFRLAQRMRRFVDMEVDSEGRNLIVRTSFPEADKERLWLKGVWGVPAGTIQITSKIEKQVSLEIPGEVHSIELLMVDSDGQIIDYFTDSQRWGLTPAGLFYQLRYVKGSQNDLEKALAMGECKTVEFKPFVAVGDKAKCSELAETVVAFLNTDGGTLFIGIDDHCQLAGFQDKLKKEYRNDAGNEVALKERYVGDLKQFFSSSLGRTVTLDFMWVDFKGDAVLQITVPKGENTPYWVSLNMRRDIYIRKGASNVSPDPDTELPRLMSSARASNPFGIDGL